MLASSTSTCAFGHRVAHRDADRRSPFGIPVWKHKTLENFLPCVLVDPRRQEMLPNLVWRAFARAGPRTSETEGFDPHRRKVGAGQIQVAWWPLSTRPPGDLAHPPTTQPFLPPAYPAIRWRPARRSEGAFAPRIADRRSAPPTVECRPERVIETSGRPSLGEFPPPPTHR